MRVVAVSLAFGASVGAATVAGCSIGNSRIIPTPLLSAAPQPAAVITPSSASQAGSAISCAAPYSRGSPWNVPIGRNPIYSRHSSAYVATMSGLTLTSDPTQYTYPIYYVTDATHLRTVTYSGWFSDVTNGGNKLTDFRYGGNPRLQKTPVPVPSYARPSRGSDGSVIVIDTDTGEEWDMHTFRGYRSKDQHLRVSDVGHYNVAWSGVPPYNPSGLPYFIRGSGLPYLAGLVRPCEIAAGEIYHALAFAYPYTTSQFQYPATKSDGATPRGSGMPEGVRLQLDPNLSDKTIRNEWGCIGTCFTIAKALQKYGMYLIDGSGRAKVIAEDNLTAHWGSILTASTVSPIPVNAFKVLAKFRNHARLNPSDAIYSGE